MKRRIGKSLLTLTLVFVMLFGSADYAYAKTTQEKLDEAKKEQEQLNKALRPMPEGDVWIFRGYQGFRCPREYRKYPR